MSTPLLAKIAITLLTAIALLLILCLFEVHRENRWYRKLLNKQPYVYSLPFRRSLLTRVVISILHLRIAE